MNELIGSILGETHANTVTLARGGEIRALYDVLPGLPQYVALENLAQGRGDFWSVFWRYRLASVASPHTCYRVEFGAVYNSVIGGTSDPTAIRTLIHRDRYLTEIEAEALEAAVTKTARQYMPSERGSAYLEVMMTPEQYAAANQLGGNRPSWRSDLAHEAAVRLLWSNVYPLAQDNPFGEKPKQAWGGFTCRYQVSNYPDALRTLMARQVRYDMTMSEQFRHALGVMWEARND